MTFRFGTVALLLTCVALNAQTPRQVPLEAVSQYAKAPVATVEASPNPAVSNTPVVLQVTVTPAVSGSLQYEIYANGRRLTECPTDSPVCQWTAGPPDQYRFNAIVRRPALGRGGRGEPALEIGGPRSPFPLTVQAPPVETPPETRNPDIIPGTVAPLPQLTVTLLSPKVVAGEAARFSVSLVNASPLEYAVDMGDGNRLTKTDAEFTHTYAQPGPATIAASYPVNLPIVSGTLDIVIEPAPAPPIALQLRAVPDAITAGESITFQVSTVDGRPLTEYSFDAGDGSTPRTINTDTVVARYSQPGQYTAAVSPLAGQAGAPATMQIVVNADPVPWIWIVVALGIVGAAVVIWMLKPTPTPIHSPPTDQPPPPAVPVPTFHPGWDKALRFKPSKGKGIALAVHYVPNTASLRYTPRVRISKEQS